MKIKEISISKIIMLITLGLTILYAIHLGESNLAGTALGVISGYLAKDIESRSNLDEE